MQGPDVDAAVKYARGVGNMPAAGFADLYVAARTAWTAGKRDTAMEAIGRAVRYAQPWFRV